jgi:hypothetical protein
MLATAVAVVAAIVLAWRSGRSGPRLAAAV